MKFIHTIKNNFVIILLVFSCIGLGILALSTALELRETRSPSPGETKALTPPCSVSFTITDTTPRTSDETATTPSPALIAQASPTLTPIQPLPSIILSPTISPTKTPTPTSTPKTGGINQPTNAASPTTLTPTPIKSGPTAAAPDVPVAGGIIPTIGFISLGGSLLFFSTFLKKK